MTVADFALLPLADIVVDRDARQRRVPDTKNIIESIRVRGVLQPIIVERTGPPHKLIAGERRLTACQELGMLLIPARYWDTVSPIEAQIIELEENLKRLDLTWQETVRATQHIHELFLQSDSGWTQAETAASIGIQPGTLSLQLRVAEHLHEDRVLAASTAREAYNILARRDAREAGNALQDLLETETPSEEKLAQVLSGAEPSVPEQKIPFPASPAAPASKRRWPDPAKSILHESFVHWAPKYSGKPFNLIHCDFPYGINVFVGKQGNASGDDSVYSDKKDVYFTLLHCLCDNLDRLMSVSGHLLFWFSEKHRDETLQVFREKAPSLVFQPFPLIWMKSDSVGIASNPTQGPRHIYETCLMATRGSRQIVRIVGDAYSSPTDKRHHISCKPEPMLKFFLTMLVDEHTSLLDPTCGSGSALRAAESLGASSVLGLEIDETNCGVARQVLGQSRVMRGMV
jgi:ParB family chromosome partitioning protein